MQKVFNRSTGRAAQILVTQTPPEAPSASDSQLALAAGHASLTADYLRSGDEVDRERLITVLDEAYAALMAALKDRLT